MSNHQHDPAMDLARLTGQQLSTAALPASLQGATLRDANARRAAFLREVAGPLRDREMAQVQAHFAHQPYDLPPQVAALAQRLPLASDLDQITRTHLPDVPDLSVRLSIALRLWAGYMDAAKMIAEGTRYETNDATTRQRDNPVVEARTAADPVYAAGVEAAPHLKHRVLGEPIFNDGIPAGAVVLRDW
jgi:hypothetical protein